MQSEDDSRIVITSKIDTYVKRKILLSQTFQIHCPSSYSKIFNTSSSLLCYLKGEQRLLENREKQQISTPIRTRSRIFLIRHTVFFISFVRK